VTSKSSAQRAEIMQIADIYRGRIVDVAPGSLIVEVTGPADKVDSILNLLRPYGIKEMVRTGLVAMTRGAATVQQAPIVQPTPTPRLKVNEPAGITHQWSA
jgi:acetolactate synthase small subunit